MVMMKFSMTVYLILESLLSYNVPQGMVRGATLELLDITYDGLEDPISGYLTGKQEKIFGLLITRLNCRGSRTTCGW